MTCDEILKNILLFITEADGFDEILYPELCALIWDYAGVTPIEDNPNEDIFKDYWKEHLQDAQRRLSAIQNGTPQNE